MKKFTLSALLAAGLLAGVAGTASAADLGGNCCADLEERIAELEATTARKGNKKVSLTISGFVAQQVLIWDDGRETNAYITDTGSVSIGTHFKFSGSAKIADGWTAGYVLNVEAIQNDSLLVSQNNDDPGVNAQAAVANRSNSSFAIESSYWFIKNDRLGRLSVGLQSSAADNQAILPDGSGSLVQANYVLYDVNGFQLRNSATGALTGVVFGQLASCYPLDGGGGVAGDCDGYPSNVIRYDTPTIAGFSASASWGEDDAWAVSARYAGEFNGVKLALGTAYNENRDENGPAGLGRPRGFEGAAFQIGGYLQHVPTGLFVYGAYAKEYVNSPNTVAGFNKPEGDMWYVKAGIRQKWNPLGHTVIYGEYGEDDDKMDTALFAAAGGAGAGAISGASTSLERYGVGLVQEIDAAAMAIWVAWRHYEPEIKTGAGANTFGVAPGARVQLEDFDLVKIGALINF
jgi:hypothetical protein